MGVRCLFFCVRKEKVIYVGKQLENNRSHHPCRGLIWRWIFEQSWLPRLLVTTTSVWHRKGAKATGDGLQSSRAPCSSEMIGRTDSNVVSNRTFHCLLLLCLGLRHSWAFFASKQVVSRCIPGLCHSFLLLKERILQGLKYWSASQTKGETIHCIC